MRKITNLSITVLTACLESKREQPCFNAENNAAQMVLNAGLEKDGVLI